MSNPTEQLAAIRRVILEMGWIEIRDTDPRDGEVFVCLDGRAWVPSADAQALVDLLGTEGG